MPMKRLAAVALMTVILLPGVAFAGSSTDAALGLGAFAVFNQILGGVGVFGRPAVIVAAAPPPELNQNLLAARATPGPALPPKNATPRTLPRKALAPATEAPGPPSRTWWGRIDSATREPGARSAFATRIRTLAWATVSRA